MTEDRGATAGSGVGRGWVAWAGVAVLCALIWVAAMHPIRDPDFGWHLALGRYIVQHGRVPDTEPFTHTAAGAPMVAHEWLSQLAMYQVSDAVGLVGLRWAHATFAALLLVAVFAMARRAGATPMFALFGVVLYALLARSRFEPRPQMFNLAAMMLLCNAVFLRRPTLTLWQIVGISSAVALWANLHSGAVLFPALLAVYWVAEFFARRAGRRADENADLAAGRLDRLAVLAGACAAATLCTPGGLRLIPYVLESNRINRGLSAEWSSVVTFIGDPSNLRFEMEGLAVAAAVCVVAIFAWARRPLRSSPGWVAVVGVVAVMPLSSQRFVDLFFLPIVFAASEASIWLRDRSSGRRTVRAVDAGVLAMSALLAPLAIAPSIDFAQLRLWLRPVANFQPVTFPMGAARFLGEIEFEGELYNIERWGGYLLLATDSKIPIFLDGRWITLGEQVVRDGASIEQRREGTFGKLDFYGVDVLLVPRGWMRGADEERRWIAVFENFNAGVYLRTDAVNAENRRRVARYFGQRGIPFDADRGFDAEAAARANPTWARAFRVEPRHVEHFRVWGNPIAISPDEWVATW